MLSLTKKTGLRPIAASFIALAALTFSAGFGIAHAADDARAEDPKQEAAESRLRADGKQ